MTNSEINEIARQQSAYDSNCSPNDFLLTTNKVVISKPNINARKYLELPFNCDLTSYGNNIVASVSENLREIVQLYINKYHVEHCFETPNILVLQNLLSSFNLNVCFMAEYFLPDINILNPLVCSFKLRILTPPDFVNLYLPEWSNALCENRKERDILAIAAYDDDKIIGLAGCSADCESMWQIGVDVLPEYRRRGVAAALTSRLAYETIKMNKVPFYCCAWSNMKSARNAIKSGFRPTWVQLTVKSNNFIDGMNK